MENAGASGRYGRLGGQVCGVIPTISNAVAYTSGDQLGGVQELKGALASEGGAAILDSIVIIDSDNQSKAMDIFLFSALPTPTSIDNGAFILTAADLANCLGVIHIAATDYIVAQASTNSVATVRNQKLTVKNSTSGIQKTSIWAVAVVRDTPTYTGTDHLKFCYGLN